MKTTNKILQTLGLSHIDLYCQAQIDIHDGSVGGMELLLRASRGSTFLVPPNVISHASRQGNSSDLAIWTAFRSVHILEKLKSENITDKVCLNLMEEDVASPATVRLLCDIIGGHNIDIELVESHRLDDFTRVIPGLEKLLDAGAKIWMDDFSNEKEDLERLSHRGLFQGVKIDRSILVAKPEHGKAGLKEITESISAMGFEIIVEGIEYFEDLIRISATPAEQGQGYFLHRPESCDDSILTFKNRFERDKSL